MSDIVKIRGLKSGLQLIFAKDANFDDVQATLLDKLETGDKFFIRGTTVFAPKDYFGEEQNEKLRRMFHRHGMLFSTELKPPNFAAQPEKVVETVSTIVERPKPMFVLNRTLRGGQEIRTESSVLIFGNVNPGAQIIAGGSIDIRGICRGTVHAGAFGDENACIVADKLRPMQIRIADIIARPPDNLQKAERAERASIKNGYIVFEPVLR